MRQWRPALRMARRDLRRHKVRALLTCLLVALPVVVATVMALTSYNSRWDTERQAREDMGRADASARVSRFDAIRPRLALWLEARPTPGAGTRDPETVDLATLLPAGTEIVPAPWSAPIPLDSGGSAWVQFVSLGSSLTEPWARLETGRLPDAPDEVALPRDTAEALGLLGPDGEPAEDATVSLGGDRTVRVVGTVDPSLLDVGEQGLTLVADADSLLAEVPERGRAGTDDDVLLDLPELSRPELRALAADLSAAGVAFRPRDAVLSPRAWGLGPGDEMDLTPLAVGALVILVGLLEVVLLVGAAFAVAARRQVRDLGLLAANGAAGAEVRRVPLAQGLVLGVGSSLVGVAVGIAAYRGLTPLWETLVGSPAWRAEIDWRAVVLIAVLGSLTSVAAALVPALSMSRLTPVQALSGRFPVRTGESRAHRGAFVLAGVGAALLLAGGWWIARAFAPRGQETPLAPLVAGTGLVLLLAGAVWATPWVVRRVAALGRLLPLSGRHAFRDAGRHRFRTAAATVALTVTVFGAVLAGFGFSAAARGSYLPERTMDVFLPTDLEGERRRALAGTLEDVLGPVQLLSAASLTDRPGSSRYLRLVGSRDEVKAMDLATLDALTGGDPRARRVFESGGLVGIGGRGALDSAEVRIGRGDAATSWTLPAVRVPAQRDLPGALGNLAGVAVSERTGADLGLSRQWPSLLAIAERPITRQDLDLLAVQGVSGWSGDPQRADLAAMQFAGLGGAALLSLLVVGVAVALAAAESRDDVATLAAVGAGPWHRRSLGAVHGLFLGLVGTGLGVLVGVPSGLALSQLDGLPGGDVPWLATVGTATVVLLAAPVAGWLVTPSRLRLTRRTG